MLHDQLIDMEVNLLRNADAASLAQLAEEIKRKRIDWFKKQNIQPDLDNILDQAYLLFLKKLGIQADQAPIVGRQKNKLVIHSKNFCPTLEACQILGLDTRHICKQLTEGPTQALLQQLNPKLKFKRNYDALRPHKPYCEEMIIFDETA